MQLFFLLVVVAIARARVVTSSCSGIDVLGVKHEKEVLKAGLVRPYQLAIDYDTNYIFFSYTSSEYPDHQFQSGYINLKTNEFGIITNITEGFANAVDQKSQTVYLGGNDGIYTFDYDTKSAVFLGAKGVNIWQLFFKDKLYYTDFPNQDAYIFQNGESIRVPELKETKAMLMTLDENDNILFSNSSGLFSCRKGKSEIIKLNDYAIINGFSHDSDNHIFFSYSHGVYAIDTNEENDVLQLAKISDVYGIAVQADHSIIYSDKNSIIRLKPTTQNCLN